MKEIWELSRIPVRFIRGVGPKNADKLSKLDIHFIHDLFFHLPVGYQNRSKITPLNRIEPGQYQSFIVRLGELRELRTKNGRKVVNAEAYDDYGRLELAWFTFPRYLKALLEPHKEYLIFGKTDFYRGRVQMTHPEITPYDPETSLPDHLLPLYPLTAGITHAYLRKIIKTVFNDYEEYLREFYPPEITAALSLPGLKEAFYRLHFPREEKEAQEARNRLAFDELFFFNLIMERRKAEKERIRKAPYRITPENRARFIKALPFTLTESQNKVIGEIEENLSGDRLMYRLLQGDVGCGKTVVAAYALYCAVANGQQGAYMAPTGVLARQHYETLSAYLDPLGIDTVLITGGMSRSAKEAAHEEIRTGKARVIIGTHALLYDKVEFEKLDMVIIDEQHKFGVAQRKSLQLKGTMPHYLIMTATPIPRTTLMAWFGDVDVSSITAMPAGRGEIKTVLRETSAREKIYQFAEKELQEGRQAYAVYPLVEDSDKMDLRSAETMFQRISKRFGPSQVALLHGKMKAEEKTDVLQAFKKKRVKFLVTTTVIEVGIDVPDATIMIIEHPERFGLAQLHQLRGRIGRGPYSSYCILLTEPSLSESAAERLQKFAHTLDGFEIAEIDLSYRGGGEILGLRQHGGLMMKIARFPGDKGLYKKSKALIKDHRLSAVDFEKGADFFFPARQEAE